VGYILAFAVALASLGRDNPTWLALFVAHMALAVVITGVIWFWHDRTTGLHGFVRHLYPLMLYSLFYRELQVATFWVFPEFLDHHVVSFERALFGLDLNVWIMRAQTAWANELMMMGYSSYYLLIPLVALPLFFRRRIAELRGMLYGTTAAFVLSYIGFVLFPVEGPRYFFADQFQEPLAGWFFVPMVRYVIDNGAIHGGCMPSSHVAVALVALFWARRSLPRLGTVLTPFVFILILATAWGRFHYVTDAVVGIIVGVAALSLTGFWAKAESRERRPEMSSLGAGSESGALRERA
jgi:hypothetical protein